MTLVSKLLVSSSMVIILVFGSLGYYLQHQLLNLVSHIHSSQLEGNVQLAIDKIATNHQQSISILHVASKNRQIRKALDLFENRGVSQVLNDLPSIYPFINYAIITEPDGTIFSVSTRDPNNNRINGELLLLNNISDNPLYTPLNEGQTSSSSQPQADPYLKIIGVPLHLSQWLMTRILKRGELIGYVILSVDWQSLNSSILKNVVDELNASGSAITSATVYETGDAALIEYKFNNSKGTQITSNELIKSRQFTIGGMKGRLDILYDQEQAFKPLEKISNVILASIAIGLISLSLLLYLLSKYGLAQRLKILQFGSETLGKGKLSYRLPDLGSDEIGQLGRTMNSMANSLQTTTTSKDKLDIEIIERKRVEAEIKATLSLLSSTLESTDNGILVTDIKGEILRSNQEFFTLWQIPEIALNKAKLQHHLVSRILDDERLIIETQSDEFSLEITTDVISTLDGKTIERTSNPMLLEGELCGRVWSYRDITSHIESEKILIKAKEVAEDAAKTKNEFLASMSHEIRTPMNGVLGMLDLLLKTHLDEDQCQKASIAKSSAQSLLTLINDILDYSKVEAGKLELESIDFNLEQLLCELTQGMAQFAQEKQLELIIDLSELHHLNVKGDPGRIRQILTNLVANAIKFTHEGEIVLIAKISYQKDNRLVFRCDVRDTGIGIPEDKLSILFDSFQQIDASTTRQYGGTGLGLTIVKQLCHLMGGDIHVSSQPNQGSCFSMEILLDESSQPKPVTANIDLSEQSLLIVDDSQTNRRVLRQQLELWGAKVTEANSGRAALKLCKKMFKSTNEPFFDIAFIDMNMPNMDGAQLGKLIKTAPKFMPIRLIMMTSVADHGDTDRLSNIGFDAYLSKPVTPSNLYHSLAMISDNSDALAKANSLNTPKCLTGLGSSRVLLVEDNRVNQLVATGILDELGLRADIANNGIEAIKKLNQSQESSDQYSVILMDCQMPEMDGYEATKAIRAGTAGDKCKDIIIIAMTANAMLGDREKCLDSGMNDYLAKPIDSERIHAKLEQYLSA
ncbi:response regulator [Shewanella eurypsychrophilus]|uniref:histidine kinase n=1 Tax=Shewanella eurypsychrophilus TaxID=2593656 RepID=A0ABX6V174_9GAMM|nr:MULTISPECIES: response regulator [Shewanella]QFU20558.1 response regulator [Shewanella sp. YLB-09]QFU20839.1 response regulator [Shewanella sp. YLB-09]QPG56127.1 response regulator [Shewanella eurypsychrophilus]